MRAGGNGGILREVYGCPASLSCRRPSQLSSLLSPFVSWVAAMKHDALCTRPHSEMILSGPDDRRGEEGAAGWANGERGMRAGGQGEERQTESESVFGVEWRLFHHCTVLTLFLPELLGLLSSSPDRPKMALIMRLLSLPSSRISRSSRTSHLMSCSLWLF